MKYDNCSAVDCTVLEINENKKIYIRKSRYIKFVSDSSEHGFCSLL